MWFCVLDYEVIVTNTMSTKKDITFREGRIKQPHRIGRAEEVFILMRFYTQNGKIVIFRIGISFNHGNPALRDHSFNSVFHKAWI